MRAAGLGTFGEQPVKPRSGPTARQPFTPAVFLHALRHTSATLALLNGVDLLEVSRWLGHTDLAFTARTYGHVKAEHSAKSAAAFDRMFGT
jgi:integrase